MKTKYAVAVYDPIAEVWNTYSLEDTQFDANRIAANVQSVSGYPAKVDVAYVEIGRAERMAA
ncbi:MAG: hypothetical protein WA789_18960 [Candidatus Acidiferrum sp.]